MLEKEFYILFCSVGLVIVGYDIKKHKIPNGLVIVGILTAFTICFLNAGMEACGKAVVSMLIPFGLLFPVYKLGMIGAGDIKFLCMFSIVLNWEQVLYFMFYACVLGGVWSFIHMLRNGRLIRRFRYLKEYVIGVMEEKNVRRYFSPEQGYEDTIAFALPIGLSYILHVGGMY